MADRSLAHPPATVPLPAALPVPVATTSPTPAGQTLVLHSDGEQLTFGPSFRCAATRRDGSGRRCKNRAISGGTVCESHGGRAPQVRAAATRRVEAARVEADITRALAEVEEDLADRNPLFALRDALTRAEARVLAYSSLTAGDPLGPRAMVLDQLIGSWLDRQARFSKLALDADLDQRLARLSEIHGGLLLRVLQGALDEAFTVLRVELEARAAHFGTAQTPGAIDLIIANTRVEFGAALRRALADEDRRSPT